LPPLFVCEFLLKAEGDQLPRSMNKLLLIEARLEFRYSEAESF